MEYVWIVFKEIKEFIENNQKEIKNKQKVMSKYLCC